MLMLMVGNPKMDDLGGTPHVRKPPLGSLIQDAFAVQIMVPCPQVEAGDGTFRAPNLQKHHLL